MGAGKYRDGMPWGGVGWVRQEGRCMEKSADIAGATTLNPFADHFCRLIPFLGGCKSVRRHGTNAVWWTRRQVATNVQHAIRLCGILPAPPDDQAFWGGFCKRKTSGGICPIGLDKASIGCGGRAKARGLGGGREVLVCCQRRISGNHGRFENRRGPVLQTTGSLADGVFYSTKLVLPLALLEKPPSRLAS